jgi:membrane dipeptidase
MPTVTNRRATPLLAFLLAVGLILPATAATQDDAPRGWEPPPPDVVERARAILAEAPLIDGHHDLMYSIQEILGGDDSKVDLRQRQPELAGDFPRMREGGIGGQFWAAYVASDSMVVGGALRHALRSIDMVHRILERYPDDLELALTADDAERIHREGRIASFIGFEGGHAIENSLEALRTFHRLGVRYLTLTHWRSTDWADAATDTPRHGGINPYGERIIREMNRLGMFVDLSHVSAQTMRDALRVSEAPVIFSHSSARAINSHPRNVPDDVLSMLPDNGGVIMVNFITGFIPPDGQEWVARRDSLEAELRAALGLPAQNPNVVSMQVALAKEPEDRSELDRRLAEWSRQNPRPRGHLSQVADHIDHIRSIVGIDNIGIGADYYTADPTATVAGLEDVTRYPYLFAELLRRGYTEEELKKIAGRNVLRAMREMETVSARLRAERRPDFAPAGFDPLEYRP